MTPMMPMMNVTPGRGAYVLDRAPRTALERAVLAAQAEEAAARGRARRRRLVRALRWPLGPPAVRGRRPVARPAP